MTRMGCHSAPRVDSASAGVLAVADLAASAGLRDMEWEGEEEASRLAAGSSDSLGTATSPDWAVDSSDALVLGICK